MPEKEHHKQDSGTPNKQPPDPAERYGVQERHQQNITELYIPSVHGALRGGDKVTKSGGLYIREKLVTLFARSKSRFSFERIPVRKILREKGLPYRNEPEKGVRNAPQIVAISEHTTKRLGDLIDAGEFPIVVGGDHSSVLMGLPEVLDRLPDPENDEYSSLKIVFLDAHPDILGDTGNAVGNAHGRTISTLLGEGPKDLMPIMGGRRKLKPENIFFIGIRNPDRDENDYMKKRIPEKHRKYLDDNLSWGRVTADLREFLYEDPDAPLWAEIDPDVMSQYDGGEGVPMPSEEGTSRTHLYSVAREIATRGNLVGMGTAEIARKKDKIIDADGTVRTPRKIGEVGSTGNVLTQFFFKALGKGDSFYDWEYNPHAVTGSEKGSTRITAQSPKKRSLRKRVLAWAGGIAAGIGGFIVGHQLSKPTDVSLSQSGRQTESISGEQFLQESRDRMYRFIKNDLLQQIEAYGTAQGSHREHKEYVALLRKVWDAESLAPGKGDRSNVFQYLLSELTDALGHQKGAEVYQRLMSQV